MDEASTGPSDAIDCENVFPWADCELIFAGQTVPCVACGGNNVVAELFTSDEGVTHEMVRIKAKLPGTKLPLQEQTLGDDLDHRTGTWSKLRRVIDRENDRYTELIVDSSGNVVRNIDVPLCEHRGHGSDKSVPKAHP